MRMLALDTSNAMATVALWEGERCLAESSSELGRKHSECLFDMFDHLLSLLEWSRQSLDAIAVGIGPGSFTGLRVGIATAQGLAFALNCPLLGVNSMDALAWGAPAGPSLVATCLDARKQEVYAGLYRRAFVPCPKQPTYTPTPLGPSRLLTPAQFALELQQMAEPILLVGRGSQAYADVFSTHLGAQWFHPCIDAFHEIRASSIAAIAAKQWDSVSKTPQDSSSPPQPILVQPLYIRPSEAEMNIGPPEGGPPLQGRIQPDGTVQPATPETSETPETEVP